MHQARRILAILAIEVIGVVSLDQLTKAAVRAHIDPEETIHVIPGLLNLVHGRNKGIAFGLLQDHGHILTALGLVALAGIALLFWWEWRRDPRLASTAWGLGLILGGALGNLIDRLRFGSVTDFIDFYWGTLHWHAFNIADSAICIGTALVLYLAYRAPRKTTHAAAARCGSSDPAVPPRASAASGRDEA